VEIEGTFFGNFNKRGGFYPIDAINFQDGIDGLPPIFKLMEKLSVFVTPLESNGMNLHSPLFLLI
jgi:hypothetical protein